MKVLLNARVSESVKELIEQLATEEGISVSQCTNNILKDYFDIYDDPIPHDIPMNTVIIDCKPIFHKSSACIKLVCWLFNKYMYNNSSDTNQFILAIKGMVENAMTDYSFSNELRFEFLKVLNDINRYLIESDNNSKQFQFCIPNNMFTFNYSLLIKEVWNLSN